MRKLPFIKQWNYSGRTGTCIWDRTLIYRYRAYWYDYPDSKVHGANMGPIWGRQDPGGPNVGPMNFAIWVGIQLSTVTTRSSIIAFNTAEITTQQRSHIKLTDQTPLWSSHTKSNRLCIRSKTAQSEVRLIFCWYWGILDDQDIPFHIVFF